MSKYSQESIDLAAKLILGSYDVQKSEAEKLAIKVLQGLDSHGVDTCDGLVIREAVSVVVSGWLTH